MANLLAMRDIRKITSRDNAQLKSIRKVREGKEHGKIFLEGIRLLDEAARSHTKVETAVVSDEFLERLSEDEVMAWLRPRTILEVPESVLQSLADTSNAQGIVAIAERPETGPDRFDNIHTHPAPLVLLLHQINNPSNLGAIIRTAEAAGVAGVITTDGSADVFSPKSLRSAMGSSLRLPIWTGVSFDEALEFARRAKLRAVAADIKGERSYSNVDWIIPHLLVFGSEAHGLDETELAKIDELIVIPMERDVESLNIAVACGVILFEARRQVGAR